MSERKKASKTRLTPKSGCSVSTYGARYTHSYGVASAVKMSATSIAMSHHWTKRDVRGSIA